MFSLFVLCWVEITIKQRSFSTHESVDHIFCCFACEGRCMMDVKWLEETGDLVSIRWQSPYSSISTQLSLSDGKALIGTVPVWAENCISEIGFFCVLIYKRHWDDLIATGLPVKGGLEDRKNNSGHSWKPYVRMNYHENGHLQGRKAIFWVGDSGKEELVKAW